MLLMPFFDFTRFNNIPIGLAIPIFKSINTNFRFLNQYLRFSNVFVISELFMILININQGFDS